MGVTTSYLISVALIGLFKVNIVLMLFNLIPIPPLDGSHVFFHFIRTRDSAAFKVFEFLERFGFFVLIALFYFGVIFGRSWPHYECDNESLGLYASDLTGLVS